ncbi:MAG: hypothetical protein GY852_06860 [bacterium]|nr:hypothetical protein [bacterium]
MASEAKKKRAEFKLIHGELKEEPPAPKKKMSGQKAKLGGVRIWAAKNWMGAVGIGVLLTLGAVGLRHLDGERNEEIIRFNVSMNIEQILESSGGSHLRELALKNLESMEKIGGEELLLLKKAIEKVEEKCKDCEPLINRMKALEKKWEKHIDSRRPISDLKWKGPGLKKAPVLKRVPQKLARSRC